MSVVKAGGWIGGECAGQHNLLIYNAKKELPNGIACTFLRRCTFIGGCSTGIALHTTV